MCVAVELSAPIVTLDGGLAASAPRAELLTAGPIPLEPGAKPPSGLVSEGREQ